MENKHQVKTMCTWGQHTYTQVLPPPALANSVPSTWLLNDIGHTTGAILAILEGDLSLAGALNCNGQASSTSFPGPNAELSCVRKQ